MTIQSEFSGYTNQMSPSIYKKLLTTIPLAHIAVFFKMIKNETKIYLHIIDICLLF